MYVCCVCVQICLPTNPSLVKLTQTAVGSLIEVYRIPEKRAVVNEADSND